MFTAETELESLFLIELTIWSQNIDKLSFH